MHDKQDIMFTDNRRQQKATLYALCVQIQLIELARVSWGSESYLVSWLELLPTKVQKLQFYNECNCQARQSNRHPIWAHTRYSLVSWCMCPRNKSYSPTSFPSLATLPSPLTVTPKMVFLLTYVLLSCCKSWLACGNGQVGKKSKMLNKLISGFIWEVLFLAK